MAETPADPPPEPPVPAPPAGDAAAPASPAAGLAAAELPQPRVVKARRWGISLVWLLPAVAIAIGASMLFRTVFLAGPRIEIEFASAEGVEAGKTDLRYKEVVIGKVVSVALRGADKHVVVGVQLHRSAAGIAVQDTTFWVVRPRIGIGGVSGLGTLLSGAYIAADAGDSTKARRSFKGLEAPPLVMRGEPGSVFVLNADDLGSLDVGSPVFHRRAKVGRVVGYTLDADHDQLSIKIFVEAPYQKLVTTATRFWNASGIDLTVNASGLTLNTQTIASILAGGLAFEDLPGAAKGAPVAANSAFRLYDDRRDALAPPDGEPVHVRMIFEQSVRGLSDGAAIDLLGLEIGRVTSISLKYDGPHARFPVEVDADIYPRRLGALREALLHAAPPAPDVAPDALVLQRLIASGIRAQVRTGNLLTGQLYVALDFIGGKAARTATDSDGRITLPTVAGTLSEVQPQIASIVEKISKIPFEEIGNDLRTTLSGAAAAIRTLTPEAQRALAEVQKTLARAQASLDSLDRNVTSPNAPMQHSLQDTLLELQRASRSLRVLSDYLQQHPESILRGKPADPALPPPQR